MMEIKINTESIKQALIKRYCSPEWAIFFEVISNNRRADAIAFNMFPSRGHEIVCMEIKVHRSDLQKELAIPEKADEIAKYCDTFYLVTPKGLTKDIVLPLNWGLIEVNDDLSCRIKKQAAENKNVKPLDRQILSSIIRRADQKQVIESSENLINEQVSIRVKQMRQKVEEEITNRVNDRLAVINEKIESVKQIESALGINLRYAYSDKELEIYKLIKSYNLKGFFCELKEVTKKFNDILGGTK